MTASVFAAPYHALYRQPALLLTLTALFWGGNTIAGQLAVGHISPFMLTLMRWVGVVLLMVPFFGKGVITHWPAIAPRFWIIVATAMFGFTGFNSIYYVASTETTAVNIGILQGSIPVFVLLLALAVHRIGFGVTQAAGVTLTLVGVALVATRADLGTFLALGINPGDLTMLVACLFYAVYTVMLKNRPEIPGHVFFTLMAAVAMVTSIPLVLWEISTGAFIAPTPRGWLIVAYVTVFPSCLAQLFFLRGVDLIGPGRAGVYVNLVPIFAAILAVLLLGQEFALYHAAALVLVLGGIWLAQRRKAS